MCVIISMKKRPTWTSKISSFILCKEYLDIEIHFQNLKTSFSRNQYNTFIFDASYLQKLPNNKSFYGKYPKRKKIRENWFISFHYFFLNFLVNHCYCVNYLAFAWVSLPGVLKPYLAFMAISSASFLSASIFLNALFAW